MAYLQFEPARQCSAGPIPAGLWLAWRANDNNSFTETQLVIHSEDGGVVYVFCYNDQRSCLAFVKYMNGVAGPIVEVKGTRYPWALAISQIDKIVTVAGQGGKIASTTYAKIGIS